MYFILHVSGKFIENSPVVYLFRPDIVGVGECFVWNGDENIALSG